MSDIMYNEVPLIGDEYDTKQWKLIATHDDSQVSGFFGGFLFLSNFYAAIVDIEGTVYPTVENAYQAMKYPKDMRGYFETCTPYEAKDFTRSHKGEMLYSPDEWNKVKVGIMRDLLYKKFSDNNKDLQEKLLATGNKELIETNWWEDTFWGKHTTSKDVPATGENMMGKLLMEVRASLLQFYTNH